MKSIRTEAQRAAARLNGKKSKGPITPRGKALSSRNCLRHGLLATAVLLPGESRERFLIVSQECAAEYLPVTPTERCLVERMIVAQWRIYRLINYERVAMMQEATATTHVPEVITNEGVWYEPCVRDAVAFQALHSRSRSGSVVQISEMRYQRQFAMAAAQLRQHRSYQALTQVLSGTLQEEQDQIDEIDTNEPEKPML